ncbi:MAG TPA: hypothetical protein VFP71_12320 [Candidatus Angelobacter sp.]|nr:hypothetical protein [Candidatus Angelobacter sp.]
MFKALDFSSAFLCVVLGRKAKNKSAESKEPLSAPQVERGLSFLRASPGHGWQRFNKVDKLGLIERPEDPGIMRADKAPTIGNKTVHSVADSGVLVPA